MSYIGSNLQIGDPTRTSAPLSDVQRFSGNASTTTFTLSRAVNFPTELEVFVENIQQEPIVAFNVSGNTLTFSESPPTGTNNIYVAYRQYVNNQVTLADGSVTYSKLANNIRLFTTDNFIPDGSTTTFTLSEAPADANTLFVMVDGMMQRAPVHYTTSGKTITFTSAPTASSNVHVRHLGFRTTNTITAFPANSSITQLTLQGDTTANGNLTVTGNTTTGNLTVTGNTTTGNLTVTGNTTTGNLTVTGRITGGGITQIQPISASVAASALTITASALTLDFRSTTLGSGTVTTVSGTPASLVVPSTATLGTVNAVQSRLVVIALNNAGTIELAVVNISGGNNLDETTLLTTTAISASSTSASTVYSTTARTSVAFRVIGYIESTQATAGTWATAPSTIQGYGGQALSAMSSLGYSQTWQTVTRTSGVTYYNTTGRPIQLVVSFPQSTGNGGNLTVNGVGVGSCSYNGTAGNALLSNVIPAGAAYMFTLTSGTHSSVELR
jgi:hypothetical protein